MRKPEILSHSSQHLKRKIPSNAITDPFFENQIVRDDEALITKQEASDFLKVSIKTIDKMVSMKNIPYYKIGVCVRFKRGELQRWAKENSKE